MSATPGSLTAERRELGRPRNRELDATVLQAVRELLVEEGYQALSVNKVTQRCGVHVRTIARRWGSKAEMVAAAITGGDGMDSDRSTDLPTGSLEADLREVIRGNLSYLSDPSTRAAFPALLAEMGTDPRVQERLSRREREWATLIDSILRRAVESGDTPESVLARGRLLPTVLGNATFATQFHSGGPSPDALADDLTEFVLAALLAP